jgi:hypothetical protein
MGKILWESDQKGEALKWFEKNFDISLELDDFHINECRQLIGPNRSATFVHKIRPDQGWKEISGYDFLTVSAFELFW